jgi:hypothetical protein
MFLIIALISLFPILVLANTYSLGNTGFEISGDLALTFRELDKHSKVNTNFRGDDPFNAYRIRTFITKGWNEDIRLAVEFLWDNGAPARVNGAYLTFMNVLKSPIYAKVGLIPSPFGNYGHRSTYFNQNPLVGIPLMWHYHTPLSKSGTNTNSSMFPRNTENLTGVPPGYDSCWDTGVSIHYDNDFLETALALTQGSLSNPRAYDNEGYQGLVRLGIKPISGMKLGASGAYAPWIKPDAFVNLPENLESYMQTAVGSYFEYSKGLVQFYSEVMNIKWDAPFIHEKELSLTTGYGEIQWKFYPGLYVATRYDFMNFSTIAVNDDGSGPTESWGYDLDRIELAVGYRIIREGFIRLDYQMNNYRDELAKDINILALQFQFAF